MNGFEDGSRIGKRPPDTKWHFDLGPLQGLFSVEEVRIMFIDKYPFLDQYDALLRQEASMDPDEFIKSLEGYDSGLKDWQRKIVQEFNNVCWTQRRLAITESGYLQRQIRTASVCEWK